MTRYIAFLRAINVGGHTVKMPYLRQLFEMLGFANVETFIASGNVVLDTTAPDPRLLEQQIEAHLRQALGYAVATFLRTPTEVATIAQAQPFAQSAVATAHALYVGFLRQTPDSAAQQRVLALQDAYNVFHFQQRELYWLCQVSTQDSRISGARLEKALAGEATLRNVTTVSKLATKYG